MCVPDYQKRKFLFILYVHRFSIRRNVFKRQAFRVAYFRSFSHGLRSPERDTTTQACRFSCFFCAAYRLLLTQTRTQCSNSASRAIAMLEKSAKISPNAWTGVSLSVERRPCGKTPEASNPKTLPFESILANGKMVHIRPYK